MQTPHPLRSEQNPYQLWRAVSVSSKLVLEKASIGRERSGTAGLEGQIHSPAPHDENHARNGKEKFIQTIYNVALIKSTAPKISR